MCGLKADWYWKANCDSDTMFALFCKAVQEIYWCFLFLSLFVNIQKLEDTVLSKEDPSSDSLLSVRGEGDSNTKVPARIREIITKNLSADDSPRLDESGLSPSVMSLQEENRMLTNELSRVEDLLSASRADRDEIAIKYQALADRVSSQK